MMHVMCLVNKCRLLLLLLLIMIPVGPFNFALIEDSPWSVLGEKSNGISTFKPLSVTWSSKMVTGPAHLCLPRAHASALARAGTEHKAELELDVDR